MCLFDDPNDPHGILLESRITKKYEDLFNECLIAAARGDYEKFPNGGYEKFLDDFRSLDRCYGQELKANDLPAKCLNVFTEDLVHDAEKEGEPLRDHASHLLWLGTLIEQVNVRYDALADAYNPDEDDEDDE